MPVTQRCRTLLQKRSATRWKVLPWPRLSNISTFSLLPPTRSTATGSSSTPKHTHFAAPGNRCEEDNDVICCARLCNLLRGAHAGVRPTSPFGFHPAICRHSGGG